MPSDREREIERICQAALEREGSARAAFLAEACADDQESRTDVESLLAQESPPAGFMRTPAAALASQPTRESTFFTGPDSVDSPVNPHPVDDDLTRSVVSIRSARHRFAPGHAVGTYRVVRLLGRGGLGEVYEAEHLDTHRRVALKVLNHTLATAADRARFLREGQLAASVNHPNSVYIFATEEIDSTLVIVMELASGGTLKDAVHACGPMPPAAAVDAILQVIDGLEAAAAIGVLHRDVKPSNCFVDGDGTVKIGDFGLSIATQSQEATQLTLTGTVLGTPAFAPPEQLRGESLDLRSDLYATGATLYYLLTGQPPFAGDGVVQIVANVLGREADSPTRLRPDVPDALAQVVQRCLAKDRSLRPDTYPRLRRELLPFSSHVPSPATPGLRVMANLLDGLIFGLPFEFLLVFLDVREYAFPAPARFTAESVIQLLYFDLLEGIWGASLGKTLFGVRIVGPGHRPVGIGRILVRTLLYLSFSLPSVAILYVPPFARTMAVGSSMARSITGAAAQLIGLALLYSTARRRNGFAGVHDLATRTRVVRRIDSPVREPLSIRPHAVQVAPDARHVGPYVILETPDDHDVDQVLLAYDQVLRRRVWIQVLPAGASDVASFRRDLARPGRLRWLTGKRTPAESWDAYDAPEGRPFVAIGRDQRSWSAVRFWLFDLVRELEMMVADHRGFVLDPEQVWITQGGRAILLDFRCPGLPARASTAMASQGPTTAEVDTFVRRFATLALGDGAADSHEHPNPSAW